MIYKAPFTAITEALYGVLTSRGCDVGLEWFDSAVPIKEIEDYFKTQVEFAYGIFGASDADCMANKTEAIWDGSLQLEIYSNYKGRKIVAEKLEALLNYLSSDAGFAALDSALGLKGFGLLGITVGLLRINLPMYSGSGVWQSGSANVSFRVHQLN